MVQGMLLVALQPESADQGNQDSNPEEIAIAVMGIDAVNAAKEIRNAKTHTKLMRESADANS